MEIDLRWPVLLLTSILLLVVIRALNDFFTLYHLKLSLDALYLLLPGLLLRPKGAILIAAIIGLLIDAFSPYLFGFHLIIFSIIVILLYLNRQAIFRANRRQTLSILLLLNLGILLLKALIFGYPWLTYGAYWQRTLSDMLLSEICLLPVGYWFLNFQNWALRSIGCNMAPLKDS